MKSVRAWGRIFVVLALTFCGGQAMGEGSYEGQPLTQVGFDRLVPITSRLTTTKFTALKPTSYPVIHPGVARVHITEKLVRPTEHPLLRTY